MSIDRAAALKRAEALLRQGKLRGAIDEYVRLVEDQPNDWASINALGDLYLQAGDVQRAVAQFVRVADHLYGEGFLPKAAALYRKALKAQGTYEPALERLAEIATRQGLLGDARAYWRHLGALRRERRDAKGAAECALRLGLLDDADADAKIAAARGAQALGDAVRAAALFESAAEMLTRENRAAEAQAALVEAARLDAGGTRLHAQLARDAVAARELDRAREFLTRESAGDDPELLLALGRLEIAAGRHGDAFAALTRFIAVAPDREHDLIELSNELAREGSLDAAYGCTEIVVDAALLAADWPRAIGALQQFLEGRSHVPALVKLVEIAGEAGLADLRRESQARLADAYLDAGQHQEARELAEALVAQEPSNELHRHRLRVVEMLAGAADTALTTTESGRSADLDAFHFEPLDFLEMTDPVERTARPPDDSAPLLDPSALAAALGWPDGDADERPADLVVGDLSDVVSALDARSQGAVPQATAGDLEAVFGAIRARAARDPEAAAALAEYERGLRAFEQGRTDEGRAALYDLAGRFEKAGEPARALAVLVEIEARSGGYRDVRDRIARLGRSSPPGGSPA